MRILAVDGGGVRGVLPAVWLAHLEARRGPAGRAHDLVAGTSTGALLACGIGAGIPASEIVRLYRDRAGDVFAGRAKRWWGRVRRLFRLGPSQPSYSPAGLVGALEDVFGPRRLGELRPRTMVLAYDLGAGRPRVFKSWSKRDADQRVVDVCRASAAAPTYFPPARVGGRVLVDGGVAANNPAAAALAEGVRLAREAGASAPLSGFRVLSLGTGAPVPSQAPAEALDWGLLEWAPRVVGLLMDAQLEVASYVCRQLLPSGAYARVQAELPDGLHAMDDPGNVPRLEALAHQVAERPEVARVLGAG